MFQEQIKELQDINVMFNVTFDWFRKHIDQKNETLPEFLKLNSLFPVGKNRDQAYMELAAAKIRDRGLEDQFQKDTDLIIKASQYAVAVHIADLQKLAAHHNEFVELYGKVVDKKSSNAFQHILNNAVIIG